MRAVVYDTAGPSSVLRVEERAEPQPGPGEVRVRIAVAGVNPTDWKARATDSPTAPKVPGQDGAGVVDAVGDGAPFANGDRVWVWDAAFQRLDGTTQEAVVLPAGHVVALPDDASFELGASLGIPALTAHLALRAGVAEPLAPGALDGRTVLVHGGAGAVGHAAIELASWAGAEVITTVSSPAKAALASAAGATHVIDYRTEDVAEAVRRHTDSVDLIVEVDPYDDAALDHAVLRPGGTVVCYASAPGRELVFDVRGAMTVNATWRFLLTYTVPPAEKAAAVAGVAAAVADGAMRIGEAAGLPVTRFPLERAADAHDAVEHGAVGTVLIDVR